MRKKKCKICSVELSPENAYNKISYYKDGTKYIAITSRCKSCICEAQQKRKFGIDSQEYNEKRERQLGICAICKEPPTTLIHNRGLFIDHDHKTNKVRGLLCHNCNTALGKFQDSELVLSNAIKYLRKYRT